MTRIEGIPVQGGVSVGPIHFLDRIKNALGKASSLSPSEELARFEVAKERAAIELKRLQAKVATHLGDNEAAIFLFQSMLLEDNDYLSEIHSYIRNAATAEYAVQQVSAKAVDFFLSLDNSYLHSRAADAIDISRRLDGILRDTSITQHNEPVILASESLVPSDPALFDKSRLLGLVSHYGSVDSHTAILARSARIPAITGIEVSPAWEGHLAVIDGDNGVLTIDPDAKTLETAYDHATGHSGQNAKNEFNIPYSGYDDQPVRLFATISSAWEAADAYDEGANGIGLYRADFLHGDRVTAPSETEQFIEYSQAVSAMHGRPVAFQSIDIGRVVRNSPLGRLSERRYYQQIKNQFRAILRAAAIGPAYLAISDAKRGQDIPRCRQIIRHCAKELASEGLAYDSGKVGAIIRTPATILTMDALTRHTDFLVLDGATLLQSTIRSATNRRAPDFLIYGEMLKTAIYEAHKRRQRIMLYGNLQNYLQSILPLYMLGLDSLSVPVKFLSTVRQSCK